MPLLRIVCPPGRTDHIVRLLQTGAATGIAVVPGAGRLDRDDLVLAEVPRSYIDPLLARVRSGAGRSPPGMAPSWPARPSSCW